MAGLQGSSLLTHYYKAAGRLTPADEASRFDGTRSTYFLRP